MKHLLSIILFCLFSQIVVGQNNIHVSSNVLQENNVKSSMFSGQLKNKIKKLFSNQELEAEVVASSDKQLFDLVDHFNQNLSYNSEDTFREIRLMEINHQNQNTIDVKTDDDNQLNMGMIFNVLRQKIYSMK
ncbi:hypothetical protein MY04_0832 [Flammeovirga sp. MY04]|uniref:hypothetical protein n=1 Tax=Flammeovirga sp. MY04 TaxID=1191459 RepID=UPI0008062572|nr:hypothetical protein [Flammeovirga sp. MY04]ANQ48214.1 hypothetical protein MY04_0832 [Flammeovirga sp. MY04]